MIDHTRIPFLMIDHTSTRSGAPFITADIVEPGMKKASWKPIYESRFVDKTAEGHEGVTAVENCIIYSHHKTMENKWRDVYNSLKLDSEKIPLLLVDDINNVKVKRNNGAHRDRSEMIECAFEKFSAPKLCCMTSQACAGLETSSTFLIIHLGQNISVIPVYEGYTLHHALRTLNEPIINQINDSLYNDIISRYEEVGYYKCFSRDDHELKVPLTDIVEKCCFVAKSHDAALTEEIESMDYTLPDGTVISLKETRYLSPENIFKPSDFNGKGIKDIIIESVMACDSHIRGNLVKKILIYGEYSNIPGLCERLENDLSPLFSSMSLGSPLIMRHEANQYLPFAFTASGGSDIPWVTKSVYEEQGSLKVNDMFY